MADGLNEVRLIGNLGADPELRVTTNGNAVLNLRLATTESYLNAERVRQEHTEWHSVTVWGKRAEALSKFLKKGSSIFVAGGLRTSSYDDKEGVKRYKTEIKATDIKLLGGKNSDSNGGGGGGSSEEAPPAGGGDDDIPF